MQPLAAPDASVQAHNQGLPWILLLGLWLTGIQTAQAHTYLLASRPAAGSIHATAPQRFVLRFQTPVENRFSHYVLVHQGKATPLKPDHRNDHGSISGPLPNLSAGSYQLRWSVMARDGHRQEGSIPFQVR
ncbi:copper resistance CopC family protein [Thermithiobacillus plumbiphilus]|uniref:Copper resistance CopC family protein n=1 Tax=Thermithiobacillus plumbiphilus TaxID=1729899 RepID=A0ABU9DAH5_9PROT